MLSAYSGAMKPERTSRPATCRMASSFDSARAPTRMFEASSCSMSPLKLAPSVPRRSGRPSIPRPVEGRGDELRVLLGPALEAEEIVIAAAGGAGIGAADRRPPLVDGAAARHGIEELADGAVDRVRLVAQNHFPGLVAFLGKLPRDRLRGQPQVHREPGHVGWLDGNAGIGAAVGGAAVTVVEARHQAFFPPGSVTVSRGLSI